MFSMPGEFTFRFSSSICTFLVSFFMFKIQDETQCSWSVQVFRKHLFHWTLRSSPSVYLVTKRSRLFSKLPLMYRRQTYHHRFYCGSMKHCHVICIIIIFLTSYLLIADATILPNIGQRLTLLILDIAVLNLHNPNENRLAAKAMNTIKTYMKVARWAEQLFSNLRTYVDADDLQRFTFIRIYDNEQEILWWAALK